MDNKEAKFILSAYRPDGQDVDDPRFAEGLEQARHDSILQRWFEESIAFDGAMTGELCASPVPSDLRQSILAGAKVSRAPHWKNGLRKWAIAAAVVLSATLGGLIWNNTRPARVANWQVQALEAILSLVRTSNFDAQSHNPADLVKWLRANHAPAGAKLPRNLDQLVSIGCKTLLWRGKPVSLICFTRPDGRTIHLVITNVAVAWDRAIKRKATLIQQGHWATATWREGNMIYMLALEGSCDELRSSLL
jgi:hypothetical protein